MLLIPLLYLSSLGWVLERDQVGSSSMVRSIPSAIFPYLGATHKRNPRGKTPLPSEVVHVDYQKVYATTNRDGNYYLISAKLKEVEAFTKGRHYSEMYPRMKEALYNLHYDLNVTRDILL